MSLSNTIINTLFPITCLGCRTEGAYLCPACFSKLKYIKQQTCLICGKAKYNGRICLDHGRALDNVLAAGFYHDPVLSCLIKKYKYYGVKDIAYILTKYLSLFWLKYDFKYRSSLVIPAPLSQKRKRLRGFNQAELLAKQFAAAFNYGIECDGLIKVKHTKPQAKLKVEKRLTNLKNCFAWVGPNLTSKNIILIDDVIDTGSTLNECARVLKDNGARKVIGLTIARG